MSLSRLLSPRFVLLTSIVCGGTSCSDDDPKSPSTTADAGAEATTTNRSTAATSSGSTSPSSEPQDAGDDTIPPDADEHSALADAGDASAETDGSVAGFTEPTPHDVILAGSLAPLVAADAGAGPTGRVQLQSLSSGQTVVTLQALGLEANTAYGAHVHAQPCAYGDGGGHYKLDPSITATEESNEIWPGFTTSDTGVGYGRITVDHRVRGDALSVVVHAPDMSKYLCADLAPEDLAGLPAEGTFSPFGAQEEIDENIEGDARLIRQGQTTSVSIAVTGLDAMHEYMAHVHALPCNVMDAGGHYKIDPTVADATESNEAWPMPVITDGGAAMGTVTVDHVTRLDAQSVVIHRHNGDTALKVACADLTYSGFENYVSGGNLTTLVTEQDAGVPELEGSAAMTRSLDGTTTVELRLEGLVPAADYGVHVHDMPCWLNSGGGHYKADESVSAAAEENEIWLNVTSDENGEAEKSVSVPFLARPEAQAVVVHAPGGARVGCIDLGL
jgi:hypothetical protein